MSDMGITAAKAYAQAASSAIRPDASVAEAGKGGEDLFGDLVGKAMSTVQGVGASAEGAITNAAVGKADLVDVVTAVAAAEATLETVVAVRDQVIRAYQEIMRMPI